MDLAPFFSHISLLFFFFERGWCFFSLGNKNPSQPPTGCHPSFFLVLGSIFPFFLMGSFLRSASFCEQNPFWWVLFPFGYPLVSSCFLPPPKRPPSKTANQDSFLPFLKLILWLCPPPPRFSASAGSPLFFQKPKFLVFLLPFLFSPLYFCWV